MASDLTQIQLVQTSRVRKLRKNVRKVEFLKFFY